MKEELDDTPQKAKKLAKKKKKEIDQLAQEIISNTETPEDVPDIPEEQNEEQVNQKYDPIPSKDEPAKPKERVVFDRGLTKDTAFIIERRNEEVTQILNHYFGKANGDYFVGNENTFTTYVNKQRRRYKCVAVEDKNYFKYILWFDMTNTGNVY